MLRINDVALRANGIVAVRSVADYNEKYSTNFSTDKFSAYHKDISDRVKGKKTKSLDILLVVNMFLTGFDSKQLSVLYVDKDLRYHDLLQAYSRTNRVEKETKPFGIIICYRNLKKRTDDALTLFSKTQDTSGIVVPGYEYFVEKFNEMVLKLKEIALFPESVDTMQNEDDQKLFVLTFRELTKYLPFDEDKLLEKIRHSRKLGKRNFIIVVSEGMGGEYGPALTERIEKETGVESRFARFAHVVRCGIPTQKDRMLGTRMGEYAVEQLLLGKSNLVICERESELVATDIAFALAMDRMYKNKLKEGDLEPYSMEQIDEMKAVCEKKRKLISAICASVDKLGL